MNRVRRSFAFLMSAITPKRTRAALGIKARRRIALSGTHILNRPIEIYPVLSWLSPREWPETGWFQFAQRYCGAHLNQFGWDVSGASNLVELSDRLRSTVMIRRTKAQVLPQLPCKLGTVVELYPDVEMKWLLKRELRAFETRFLRVDHDSIDWDDLAVVRHETALAKVPLIAQYATELLDGGLRKIVIFAHHRDVVARLQDGRRRLRVGFSPILVLGLPTLERPTLEDFPAVTDDLNLRSRHSGSGIRALISGLCFVACTVDERECRRKVFKKARLNLRLR